MNEDNEIEKTIDTLLDTLDTSLKQLFTLDEKYERIIDRIDLNMFFIRYIRDKCDEMKLDKDFTTVMKHFSPWLLRMVRIMFASKDIDTLRRKKESMEQKKKEEKKLHYG